MKKYILITLLLLTGSKAIGQKIFDLIEKRDYTTLKYELKNGLETEQFNEKGLTPLWLSVFKNDTTAVNLLLNNGADLNFLEKNGMHPIMVGCIANSVESVEILLKRGADVNWKSSASRNQQPIRFASQGGSLELIKLLLSYGADMESTPDDRGTPLLASLHAGKFDIAEFYFQNGANVKAIGRDGECVIHEAIKSKNPNMVKLALKYGTPLDLTDPDGKTTWQLAKKSGNSEIKALIKDAIKG